MLAGEVFVSVYGTLSGEGFYSGYITDGNYSNNVFIMSKYPVSESFPGIVTATVNIEDGTQKLVVSPRNEIMYEPEIMDRLKRLKNLQIKKITCLYEKSCGAVILHRDKRTKELMVLMVRNNNGRFYSFPKGHMEFKENEKQTAIREIKEETNLDVEILDGFREISDYCPFGKIRKRVVFFLAIARENNIKIQESEIDSYNWVPLNGAKAACSYDNDCRVIEKVRKYMETHHPNI